ncbi:MAG: hypothetical protein E7409_04930 [Ruminococcaceae bacterium]|nr:hypothetical protein [Oscillospiraceae bacterium]
MARYYSLSPRTNRRRRTWKTVGYVAGCIAIFAISFVLSFRLVESSQNNTEEIEALKSEISVLHGEIAARDEQIESLQMQLKAAQEELFAATQVQEPEQEPSAEPTE